MLTASQALELDDETIAARVCGGEVDSFEAIMRRYNQRLFRTARAIVRNGDEAEDVVQEAYLQAYAHLADFEGRASFATWLTRIVVHEAYRRVRRQRKGNDAMLELGHQNDDDPERIVAAREMATVVETALDALPEEFRVVFMLRVVERLDVAETARSLDIPEATVKTRLHRARKLLQRHLDQQTEDALTQIHTFLGDRCDRIVAGVLARLRH